jgi:hypothetical protein
MSLPNLIQQEKRQELIEVATAMLAGAKDPIEGIRKLAALRHATGDPDNPAFLAIRAFESETDHFPIGKMRETCSVDYLQRMDEDMTKYVSTAKRDILTACEGIIREFASR